MSIEIKQVPFSEALRVKSSEQGKYVHKVPPSFCFGSVAFGGYISSYIHKACADFTLQSPKTASHHDVYHSSIQFFRPVFPDPREIKLNLTIASANKRWTILHAELKQDGKLCDAGYITLCDFSVPGKLTIPLGWQMSPPPPAVNLEALKKDKDPGWVTYRTPWDPKGLRKPHMYVSHSVPITQPATHGYHTTDQWIRAKWPEPSRKPAKWTDEMIPFILDIAAPILPHSIDESLGSWNRIINAGKLQAAARARGESDNDMGYIDDQTGLKRPFPYVASTLNITVEVKKRLPKEGVEYVALRASMKRLTDDRMDYELLIHDEQGDLVAVGSQVMVCMPISVKQEKKHQPPGSKESKL